MTALDPQENVPPSYRNAPIRAGRSVPANHGRTGRIEPFRFLQASDFRLDTPCYGVTNLPEDLRDRFVEARYLAAERVFDTAIRHNVDFLVLAGGLLDARLPGLRGPWFLSEQFQRLADHGIAIYWAGSTFETQGRWPEHVGIPANVHRLSSGAASIVHQRQGHSVAHLLSIAPREVESFEAGRGQPFVIAVQPRSKRVPERWHAGIDYWALGGQSHFETEQVGDVVAHFAGSPQGRSPSEVGRHSCSLVQVDHHGGVHIEPIATNAVRWHHESFPVPDRTTWPELEQQLRCRQAEFHADPAVQLVMGQWTISGSGQAVQRLLEPEFCRQLLDRLNAMRTDQPPQFFTFRIEVLVDSIDGVPQQQGEAPLAAFLQELQAMAADVDEALDAPPESPHFRGQNGPLPTQRLLQQVRNEGARRLVVCQD